MQETDLHQHYARLWREGECLAGGLNDLAQRAATYHHLYEHSGGNHVFPLIAAHGALWARGYFRLGAAIGRWLSLPLAVVPGARESRLAQLAAFADAFRDINRRVCAETYASYHFSRLFGDSPDAAQVLPREMLAALRSVHEARRCRRELADNEKRRVFQAFFLHEQRTVVGPAVAAAARTFRWRLMKWLALRPRIRFAYLPRPFWFRNFARQEERVEKGLRAFDQAAAVGWRSVEESLRDYAILPAPFFADSAQHFADIRAALCVT